MEKAYKKPNWYIYCKNATHIGTLLDGKHLDRAA